RLAVSGAQGSSTPMAKDPNSNFSADAAGFEVGETRLAVSARHEGDSIHLDVPDFSFASLAINQFLLTATEGDKGIQLWSEGASSIQGVRYKGRMRLDARTKGSRELADYRLAQVEIDEFRIDRLEGNGLGFSAIGEKLEVAIKSG